jgi:large subunit ribosomal protein L25
MRTDITLTAEPRTARGKNEARRARRSGKIPAVVYGAFQDAVAVALDPRALNRIIHSSSGYNTIFNLDVGGSTTPVMIADHQNDPIRGTLLHADLKRIDLSKRLRVSVPVHTMGDPKGVKQQGGHFEIVTRAVEIECLPDDIPEHFTMDVTELLIGQNLRASDIPLSGSMKLLSQPEAVLAHVVGLRGEQAEAVAAPAEPAAAEAAQPEVIKKGKKEEEAAGEKGGAKKK